MYYQLMAIVLQDVVFWKVRKTFLSCTGAIIN